MAKSLIDWMVDYAVKVVDQFLANFTTQRRRRRELALLAAAGLVGLGAGFALAVGVGKVLEQRGRRGWWLL